MSGKRWAGQKAAYAVYAASVAACFLALYYIVPEPYMDEIFHVRQAQTYTNSWLEYDDKLTTPPGLYISSALLARYVTTFASSVPGLRAVNAILLLYLPHLVAGLLDLIRSRTSPRQAGYLREALCISTFPLVYFFGFLYYTDVASLVLVLVSYRQALRKSYATSALAGLASLSLRQTNILWVAYIAFEALCLEMDKGKTQHKANFPVSNDLGRLSFVSVWSAVVSLLAQVVSEPFRVLSIALPYIPVAACFVAFLIWNGGIVLGDKSMHVAVLHVPQIYYFLGFTSAMLVPYLFKRKVVVGTLSTLFGTPAGIATSCIASGTIAYTVNKFTIAHPFILADNRHFPFYIWRRIINYNQYSRYILSPAYLASATALWHLLSDSRTWGTLPFLAYSTVTCLTLIPSPLIEFRYFIIPFLILRLHVKPYGRHQLYLEAIFNAVVNIVTFVLFLYRPFKWASESGWQRFMW